MAEDPQPDAEPALIAEPEVLFCVLLEEHSVPMVQGDFIPTRVQVIGGRTKFYGRRIV